MSTSPWSKKDLPSLDGKLAIVTGGTGGLGYETALGLAEAGATVVVAGRNETKGADALAKIKAACPQAKVSFGKIDLGSLASVKEFANEFNSKNQALDILVNNAGIMAPPKRLTTADGFEIQLGTNHLCHFALTAQLLPSLQKSTQPARVVNVSSIAARQGKIYFDDLQAEKSYWSWLYYCQSKLANLLFTFELQRKSDEGKWGIHSIAAHPGFSRTDLMDNGQGKSFLAWISNTFLQPMFSQSAADGALNILYAAAAPEAKPAGYYGPQGFREMNGVVGPAKIPALANDKEVASKFWEVSVNLTGVTWP